MNKVLKSGATLLAFPLVKLYKRMLIKLVRNEALDYYNKTIRTTRKLFVAVVAFLLCLVLLMSGFIMIHIGAFLYLSIYLAKQELALLLFCLLGFAYFFLSLLCLFYVSSERTWLKFSKCNQLLEKKL